MGSNAGCGRLGLAAVLAALSCGCGPRVTSLDPHGSDSADGGYAEGGGEYGVLLNVNKDVDLLFVVDNSGSMGVPQGLLAAGIPALLGVLEDPAVAASYRIGVTTTDNGNPWCGTTTPEAGKLQISSCRSRTGEFVFDGSPSIDATAVACTDVCATDTIEILPTTTEFDPAARPRPWIESTEGRTNLGGDVTPAEAFRCVAPQGVVGCGFESHLESMYKALVRAQTPDEDQYGFLRSNAILSIIIVSDAVDCSYDNAFESIFLPEAEGGNQVFWSDPDASAPTSAVCWNAGVLCDGDGTPYDGCGASNKDTAGIADVPGDAAVLHPIGRYVDLVQQIEEDKHLITPRQEVLVALVGGVPVGYDGGSIEYSISPDPGDQAAFGIGPGCTYDDGDPMTPEGTARPPVRMREFAESFAVNGENNLYSICESDYSTTLSAIGNAIREQIRPACMTWCVADTSEADPGLQPQCTLIQERPDVETGDVVETVVEPCVVGGALPPGEDVCFESRVDDELTEFCADLGWNLEFRIVRREGAPSATGAMISASCELSQNKATDCPDLP